MMNTTFASKATVGTSTAPILDHTYADAPTPLSGKEAWLYNEYESTADIRQRMALAVAWKNKATQPIRTDHELRSLHMADIIQEAMVAAYEPYSLKDCEKVWYRKVKVVQADGSTLWVREEREKVKAMTEAEREVAYAYKHIEAAVRKAVKQSLDLKGREALIGEPAALDTVTAERIHDAYLSDVQGSEWDRLDAMLKHCEGRLYPTQIAQLRRLVAGEVTLSQLPPRSREAIRMVVLETLHLNPTIVG